MPSQVSGPQAYDGRSAVQIVADGDARWPNTGLLYIPPQLLDNGPDSLRKRKDYVRKVLRLEAVLAPLGDLNHFRRTFTRAGGGCVCNQCGLVLYDHPNTNLVDCLGMDEWSGRTAEEFAAGMAGRGFSYRTEEYTLSRGRFVEHIWER